MTECMTSGCDQDAEYSGRPGDADDAMYEDLCRDCAPYLADVGGWDIRQKESGEP